MIKFLRWNHSREETCNIQKGYIFIFEQNTIAIFNIHSKLPALHLGGGGGGLSTQELITLMYTLPKLIFTNVYMIFNYGGNLSMLRGAIWYTHT